MEGLEVDWGDVFRAVSQSPLGIVALVVVVLAFVAVIFFRSAGNAVKLSVFSVLALAFCGLVGVVFHERGDLQQTVEKAKELSKFASRIDFNLAAIENPDAQNVEVRADTLIMETAVLSDLVAATPALSQQPQAEAAQRRLVPKRAGMQPRKDPRTGEIQSGPQPLDADTKDAARELSRAVVESLKGKDPLELRELLREKPGG